MIRGTEGGARTLGLLLAGAIAGVLLVGAARFAGQPHEHPVHYHANWAVFIDGERLDLSADRYMEDVTRCSVDPSLVEPEDRVHMHENDQDVVHVHAAGVTWGHLLANLGFTLSDDLLVTDAGSYVDDGSRSLKFILNGNEVRSIRNRRIGDLDRLLISYGAENVEEVVRTQYPAIQSSAESFNMLPDPASCSGQEEITLGDRLRRAFWY